MKVSGTHIKHSANVVQRLALDLQTTFLVKANSPYMYAIKKIDKMVNKFNSKTQFKNVRYITVKGMGKAMVKTASIGLKFQNDGNKVDFFTGSVQVLDEFVDEEDESEYSNRMVSYLEVRIWIK